MNLLRQVFDTINPLSYIIHPKSAKDKDRITVMQWNMLNDRADKDEFILPKTLINNDILDWEYRCKRIVNNIRVHSPDFVTFQEGDKIDDILSELINCYKCIYSTCDGANVGVMYDIKKYIGIEFYELEKKIVIGKFLTKKGTEIWVGSAHLASGKKMENEQKRLEQIKIICQFYENKKNWIMGMDCNTDYGYTEENLMLNYLDNWLPTFGNVTDYPDYTTLKIRSNNSTQEEKKGKYICAIIDRIISSSSLRIHNRWTYPTKPKLGKDEITKAEFKVKNNLAKFSDNLNLRQYLLPNMCCPSDHLYVLSELNI